MSVLVHIGRAWLGSLKYIYLEMLDNVFLRECSSQILKQVLSLFRTKGAQLTGPGSHIQSCSSTTNHVLFESSWAQGVACGPGVAKLAHGPCEGVSCGRVAWQWLCGLTKALCEDCMWLAGHSLANLLRPLLSRVARIRSSSFCILSHHIPPQGHPPGAVSWLFLDSWWKQSYSAGLLVDLWATL